MNAPARWCLLTCLVASLAYSGAVTTFALLAYVLPSTLLLGLLGGINRDRAPRALLLVVPVALAGAEVVNLVSGNAEGPAARSSFLAGLSAGVALGVSALGPLFLVPMAALIGGALALGAGAEVGPVAVVTAVLATTALASVEKESRHMTGRRGRSLGVLVALPVVALAAAGALLLQSHLSDRTAYQPFPAVIDASIRPPLSADPTPTPLPTSEETNAPEASAAPLRTHQTAGLALRGLLAVGVLALIVLVAALRLLWVSWSWRRLRRSRALQGAAGPWLWVLAQRQRLGQPLPAWWSPDLVAAGAVPADPALQVLAGAVATAMFSSGPSAPARWEAAAAAVRTHRADAERWRRVRARWSAAPKPQQQRQDLPTSLPDRLLHHGQLSSF